MKYLLVGFTVLALAVMTAGPALAHYWGGWGSDITVTNTKNAIVVNEVIVSAGTGDNNANGGSGGAGGDIDDTKAWKGGYAKSGNGGAGGDGGSGGTIVTGDAYAKAKVYNKVNTDYTSIDPCPDCTDIDDIDVTNEDNAIVDNLVAVGAYTDANDVNGGSGGAGGDLDDTKAWKGGDAYSGSGGAGGDGGNGGYVNTGSAYAKAKVFNKINTVITRIK